MSFTKTIKMLRHIAYILTTGLCMYLFIHNYHHEDYNRFICISLALACMTQLFLKKKAIDLLLGFVLVILWGVVTLGLLFDEIGDVHWGPYKEPGFYFAITSFLASLNVILQSIMAYSEKNSPAVIQPD